MVKILFVLVFVAKVALCNFEVIPVVGPLSSNTEKYFWPTYANGAISINSKELVIPDGSRLYIQSRTAPFEQSEIRLTKQGKNYFKIYEVATNENIIGVTILAADGRFYLLRRDRLNGKNIGPIPKHGKTDRMFVLPDKRILATGLYRPRYVKYLDLYDDESQGKQTQKSKDMFLELYNSDKAFTLAIYDENLNLIDSGNVVDRVGEDAQIFERQYIKHPVDITSDNTVYLIDNSDGYIVEKYENMTTHKTSFLIKNPHFKKIPKQLKEIDLVNLRKPAGQYSVPYALYVKQGFIISSFFQVPKWREKVKPPYYYDVCTLDGELVTSGEMSYPIFGEDDKEKIFLIVKIEGGWFEDDKIFLVGITVHDILMGRITKEAIDASVVDFMKEQDFEKSR